MGALSDSLQCSSTETSTCDCCSHHSGQPFDDQDSPEEDDCDCGFCLCHGAITNGNEVIDCFMHLAFVSIVSPLQELRSMKDVRGSVQDTTDMWHFAFGGVFARIAYCSIIV